MNQVQRQIQMRKRPTAQSSKVLINLKGVKLLLFPYESICHYCRYCFGMQQIDLDTSKSHVNVYAATQTYSSGLTCRIFCAGYLGMASWYGLDKSGLGLCLLHRTLPYSVCWWWSCFCCLCPLCFTTPFSITSISDLEIYSRQ